MLIIPALLSKDKDEFLKKLRSIEELVEIAQIDVMDNTLVPETTFGRAHELAHIKTSINYELHLMVDHPIEIIRSYTTTPNIKRVYVHAESKDELNAAIEEAKIHGFEIGIAINPETPTSVLNDHLYEIDSVLFMGVNPGASGRPFHPEILEKIKTFHEKNPKMEIAVDGSVNHDTIVDIQNAGATRFAVGSTIFNGEKTPQEALEELHVILSETER